MPVKFAPMLNFAILLTCISCIYNSTLDRDYGQAVVASKSGDVLVTGILNEDNTLSSAQPDGLFVWNYPKDYWDLGGQYRYGIHGPYKGMGIACSSAGHVLIVGIKDDTTQDALMCEFDLLNHLKLNRTWTWGGDGRDACTGIVVDKDTRVFLTGYFEGNADLDPSPQEYKMAAMGTRDGFVSEVDSDGKLIWATSLGGKSAQVNPTCISLSEPNLLYIAGGFTGEISDPQTTQVLASNGDLDCFLACLTKDGKLKWLKSWGGPGKDKCNGLAIDGSGNVVIVGIFQIQ